MVLLFFLSALAPSATPQNKPPASQPSQPTKSRVIWPSVPKTHHHKHGPRDMADGKIKDVRCHGPRLEMEFETSGHLLYLRTGNYFVIGFSAINYTSSKEWNPCKGLKGRYARVRFYDIKGHPDQGDLISLALRK